MIINKIYHNDKKLDGSPYRDKNGKSYVRVVIKTPSYPADVTFLDYNGIAANWQDGQHLDLDKLGMIVTEGEWQGKKQFTLGKPRKQNPELADLTQRVIKLEERVNAIAKYLKEHPLS